MSNSLGEEGGRQVEGGEVELWAIQSEGKADKETYSLIWLIEIHGDQLKT